MANGEQSPVVNVRKTGDKGREGRLKSKLHPCWKRAREIPSWLIVLMMEEAAQPLLSPQLLRLLLVQGVWRDGGHWSVLRWVSLNGLPHGLIQQLHQLALRLLQQLCLDSLQDKAGAESPRSLHPVSLPPIHQTLPEPTSVPGTPLRSPGWTEE